LVWVVLLLISLTWLASIFVRFQLSLTTVDIWLVPVHSLRLSGIVHLSFSLSSSYLLYMAVFFGSLCLHSMLNKLFSLLVPLSDSSPNGRFLIFARVLIRLLDKFQKIFLIFLTCWFIIIIMVCWKSFSWGQGVGCAVLPILRWSIT
jgi:hypothetical protein